MIPEKGNIKCPQMQGKNIKAEDHCRMWLVDDPYCVVLCVAELLIVVRTLVENRSVVVVVVVVVVVAVDGVDLYLVLATLVAITAYDDSSVGPSVGALAVVTHVLHGLLDER